MNHFDRAMLLFITLSAGWTAYFSAQPAAPPQITNDVHVEEPSSIAMTERGEFDTDTGTFIRYPDDVAPEQDFIRDCRSVCTRPDTSLHLSTDPPPSDTDRVLYMDPTHMICACFRPNARTLGQVERYVAWRREAR
jgi:hypothetical protein